MKITSLRTKILRSFEEVLLSKENKEISRISTGLLIKKCREKFPKKFILIRKLEEC